ncbi:hypothetical protein LTR08_000488 [Meristemomyces frigidus]|nr:hypothetical protein LTR08_000488 [Meristemomyces frigidus]
MDQTVEVVGWQADWISRTLPSLQTYTCTVIQALSLAVALLSLLALLGIRRSKKELDSDPNNRAAIFKHADLRLLKISRGHWGIANLYMLNAFVVAMVDAYIGLSVISKDVSENPQKWDSSAMLGLGAYCLYLMVVFALAFFIVPFLQMLCVTYLLASFARRRGVSTLSKYVPLARLFSSHIAQLWAFISFATVTMWTPAGDQPFYRYILLQAAIGSTVAWLDASFAFNFCADKLADEDLTLSTGGVTEIVRLFGKAAKATHTWEKKGGDMLPRYEEVSQQAIFDEVDDKTTQA